jgi:hypothetical protein
MVPGLEELSNKESCIIKVRLKQFNLKKAKPHKRIFLLKKLNPHTTKPLNSKIMLCLGNLRWNPTHHFTPARNKHNAGVYRFSLFEDKKVGFILIVSC